MPRSYARLSNFDGLTKQIEIPFTVTRTFTLAGFGLHFLKLGNADAILEVKICDIGGTVVHRQINYSKEELDQILKNNRHGSFYVNLLGKGLSYEMTYNNSYKIVLRYQGLNLRLVHKHENSNRTNGLTLKEVL